MNRLATFISPGILRVLVLILGCCLPMSTLLGAGAAYFADGRGLTIEDAWNEDGIIYLRLPGGGVIGTEEARVARVHLPQPVLKAEEPAPPAVGLEGLARQVARRHGLDEDLMIAVVQAESGFNPAAVSRVGAQGLMQLMPATAAELEVDNPLDPAQNLDGGARYLKSMLHRFQGREDLALAAYNAGPTAVSHYGGVPPFRETREYVRRVLAYSGR